MEAIINFFAALGRKHRRTLYYEVRDFFKNVLDRPCSDKNAKVSIVIPVRSDSRKTGLAGIKKMLTVYLPKQGHQNYEAIVYSDGPDPELGNFVRLLGDARVRFLETSTILGKWGHPQTREAIKLGTGQYFLRMNDDNRPYPWYLEVLLSGFKEGVGISYGRVLFKGEARRVHQTTLKSSFILPRDSDATPRHGNIDCMNYMVKMELAKKCADHWTDAYAADWKFLEACLKEGARAEFIDRLIGDKL